MYTAVITEYSFETGEWLTTGKQDFVRDLPDRAAVEALVKDRGGYGIDFWIEGDGEQCETEIGSTELMWIPNAVVDEYFRAFKNGQIN